MALAVKNPPVDFGDVKRHRFDPWGQEGHGNSLLYSCLENPCDRGAQWVTVRRVMQSWTRLKRLRAH